MARRSSKQWCLLKEKTMACFFFSLIFYSLSIGNEKERKNIISGFCLAIIKMLTDQLDLQVSFLLLLRVIN